MAVGSAAQRAANCTPSQTLRGARSTYSRPQARLTTTRAAALLNSLKIMFGWMKDWRRVASRYDRCPKVSSPPLHSQQLSSSGYRYENDS